MVGTITHPRRSPAGHGGWGGVWELFARDQAVVVMRITAIKLKTA